MVDRNFQVGGQHYASHRVQPWDIIDEYKLGFYEGNVVKYLLRRKKKGNRLEDLKKARHYLDKQIAVASGEKPERWWKDKTSTTGDEWRGTLYYGNN